MQQPLRKPLFYINSQAPFPSELNEAYDFLWSKVWILLGYKISRTQSSFKAICIEFGGKEYLNSRLENTAL